MRECVQCIKQAHTKGSCDSKKSVNSNNSNGDNNDDF
jgi:hypothetical protein